MTPPRSDDRGAVAAAVTEIVDGIPFFIHHVVDEMAQRGGVTNETTVRDIVNANLTGPLDRWHLGYYQERIHAYYAETERPYALNLLDVLSTAPEPVSFDDAFNLVKAQKVTEDIEQSRQVLTQLQRDHYILQQTDGKYRFRFPLIQRWWRINRGLKT